MKSIWKVMLAVCCLGMTIGCGTNPSKNENVKETLPALVVNGTQLMNTEGDTVVLHGVSYGWHQFWPRFYNASSVAYLVNDWGAQVLRASMGVDLDSACYVNKPEFGIECVTKVVDAAIENGVYVIIDWHSHNLRQEEAKEFFTQMAMDSPTMKLLYRNMNKHYMQVEMLVKQMAAEIDRQKNKDGQQEILESIS